MSDQTLIERTRTAAASAVNHELLTSLADALETAERANRCQFSDAEHLEHRPFTERAPICWDCHQAIVDELIASAERAESLVRTLGAALERYADETAWTDGVCEFRATPNRDSWGSVVDWTGVHDNGALARAALTQFQEFLTHQEAESDGP